MADCQQQVNIDRAGTTVLIWLLNPGSFIFNRHRRLQSCSKCISRLECTGRCGVTAASLPATGIPVTSFVGSFTTVRDVHRVVSLILLGYDCPRGGWRGLHSHKLHILW